MPHPSDQSRPPRRSIFQTPRHSAAQFLARTELSTTITPPHHFSDGSHNLRRSLNVAQNLSQLAETPQPMIHQMMSAIHNNNNTNNNNNSNGDARLSTWSQQPRIGHSQAIVGLTTSLAGAVNHSISSSSSLSSSSLMSSSGRQTFQQPQQLQRDPQVIHPATPAYTNNHRGQVVSVRDSVMEQMRSHVQSPYQQQPHQQQWHQDDSNNYSLPGDDSESHHLDTESEEEGEGEDGDMELDEQENEHDRRYYAYARADDDHGQRQYYPQAPSGRSSSSIETPSVAREQNYAPPQGSSPRPPLQQQRQAPLSHRHPQQLPSSRRIVLPPQEMPPLSWSRQTSTSSGYSSRSSHSQNQLQQQPWYIQRHPQEVDHQQRHDSYRQPTTPEPYTDNSRQQQQGRQSMSEGTMTVETSLQQHQQRPAFLTQPVYQLACAACIRPLCLRAMKAVMLSDHSKELYSTDMPPAGLQLVNDDRQVRHCACRIRDSACLGCGQVAGYHVTQPCSDCLKDQNNGHFWMFYSSAVVHYKRLRVDGHVADVMLWANVPSINYDQALAQQLRREVSILSIRTTAGSHSSSSSGDQHSSSGGNINGSNDERPLTACVEMEEWLNSPMAEVVCR